MAMIQLTLFIVSHNNKQSIKKSIESVLLQRTHIPFHIHILEFSANESREITHKLWKENINIERSFFYPGDATPEFISGTINDHIKKCKDVYVSCMTDRDILCPTYINDMVQEIEEGMTAVYCGTQIGSRYLESKYILDDILTPGEYTKEGSIVFRQSTIFTIPKSMHFEPIRKSFPNMLAKTYKIYPVDLPLVSHEL